jgi:hypothetical protein
MRSLAEALGVPRKTLHDKLRKHGCTSKAAATLTPMNLIDLNRIRA